MGLGLAYAGTEKEDLKEYLKPFISDHTLHLEISAMAALSLGLVFVGSGDAEIAEAILEAFTGREDESQLKDKWSQFLSLGLALLYVGRQEDADVTMEVLLSAPQPIGKATEVLVRGCAYAGEVRHQRCIRHS